MFFIPTIQHTIDAWKFQKDDILSEIEGFAEYKELPGLVATNATTYHADQDPQKYIKFFELISDYIQDLDATTVTRVWYKKYKKGDYHQVHNHGAIGWSAIFYAQYDPEEHPATVFHAPFHDHMTGGTIKHVVEAVEGDLLIFPSYLYHYVPPCQSDKERSVIAFNMI